MAMGATEIQCQSAGAAVTGAAQRGEALREGTNKASERICRELREDQPGACHSIRRLITVIGVERADELVRQSEAVQAAGGILLPDGSRRRTLGGVFFKLVQDTVPEDERYKAWPWKRSMTDEERREWKRQDREARRTRKRKARSKDKAQTKSKGQNHAASLAACGGLVGEALKKGLGVTSTMKITVVGRPGAVVQHGQAMLTVLEGTKVPTLPRGLPTPEKMPRCAVFISAKQWRKVADAIKNEQDALVIEGVPTLDPGFNGLTVLATSVTTKLLDKAKRDKSLGG